MRVFVCTYECMIWQLVSSWHWNLLHHRCAVMKKSISGGRLFKIFELSLGETSISHPAKMCVSAVCSSSFRRELLEASENWVVSPSQITSCFVMVSRLWLAISDLHGEHFWPTCATVMRQPGIVLAECQEWVTSKPDLGFLAWYNLGLRDTSRMEKMFMENKPYRSKVFLSVKS